MLFVWSLGGLPLPTPIWLAEVYVHTQPATFKIISKAVQIEKYEGVFCIVWMGYMIPFADFEDATRLQHRLSRAPFIFKSEGFQGNPAPLP